MKKEDHRRFDKELLSCTELKAQLETGSQSQRLRPVWIVVVLAVWFTLAVLVYP